MKPKRGQEGFTLVELLGTILCGTIVFAAAVTILLLGLRMNAKNTANARQQNEVRIVFSMLEDMVAENEVKISHEDENRDGEPDAWSIKFGEGESVTISYSETERSIKNGDSTLMDELIDSTCTVNGRLITISITTENGTVYTTTVYCRVGNAPLEGSRTYLPTTAEVQEDDSVSPRTDFLSTLTAEIGSTGKITGTDTGYSQWYTAQQEGLSWPEDTPWCACFLSWAAAQVSDGLNSVPYFARVNDGIWGFNDLDTGNGAEWDGEWHSAGEYVPAGGDFIFFNLDADADADHVGAVFSVEGNTVFTIEGNCNGKVTVCSYSLDDASIVGYGVLDWKATE